MTDTDDVKAMAMAERLRAWARGSDNEMAKMCRGAADLLDRLSAQAQGSGAPLARPPMDMRLSNEQAVIDPNYSAPIDSRSTIEMMADRDAHPSAGPAVRTWIGSDPKAVIARLQHEADACDDMSKWATPELSHLLREAASVIAALSAPSGPSAEQTDRAPSMKQGAAHAPSMEQTIDVTGVPPNMVEDIKAHIRGAVDKADGYEYELGSGWRCFHCGEMFRTHGGAELHFGNYKSSRPVCANADTGPSESGECPPRAVFSDPTSLSVEDIERQTIERCAKILSEPSEIPIHTFTVNGDFLKTTDGDKKFFTTREVNKLFNDKLAAIRSLTQTGEK